MSSGETSAGAAWRLKRAPNDWLSFDYAFTLIVFATALFVRQLGSLAPLIFIAAAGAFFLLRLHQLSALSRCTGAFVIVFYVLLSAAWSADPGATLYYGAEYAITVLLACQIGSSVREPPLLFGLFSAFFIFGVANFVIGVQEGTVTFTDFYGHHAYTGLMASKNTQADISALGSLVALSVLIYALRHRNTPLSCSALLLLTLDLLLVANAQSAGAVVAVLLGSVLVLTLSFAGALSAQARTVAFLVSAGAGAVALLTRSIWLDPLFQGVLKIAGKDSTLTGRTYIWERADVAIQEHPWLGMGFSGFWRIGYLEAEAIWRRLDISGRSGFNFHNTYYEIRVHLGLIGVILFAAVFIPAIAMLIARVISRPSPMTVMFTALMLYEASRMTFESIGLGLFHYTTYLVFAAAAWATRLSAPVAEARRPARAVSRRPTAWRSV